MREIASVDRVHGQTGSSLDAPLVPDADAAAVCCDVHLYEPVRAVLISVAMGMLLCGVRLSLSVLVSTKLPLLPANTYLE